MAKTKEQPVEGVKGQPDEAVITPAGEAGVNEEEATGVAIVPQGRKAVMSMADVTNLALMDSEEDLNFTKDDVAIPFLRVLQTNSPQVKKQNAKYVVGAEAGMFFNSATNKLWERVHVLPVWFTRQATLWLPRGEGASGGGFVGEWPLERADELLKQCVRNEKNKDITPMMKYGSLTQAQNLELVIAALYYVVAFNPDDPSEFETLAFPLTSTQFKKARTWNAYIKNARLPNPAGGPSYRPAMFGIAYEITTVPESNTKGDWLGVKITPWKPLLKAPTSGAPAVEQFEGAANLYLAARDFAELVKAGAVKAKADEAVSGTPEDDGGSMGPDDGAPAPF